MKHNKQKNVGIMFEILSHAVLREVSEKRNRRASRLYALIKENFLKDTEISKAYKIYSQFIYSEARNVYSANLFIRNLIKEYTVNVNKKKLDAELSRLSESISRITDKKNLLKINIPNYKTIASFHIRLHEGNQYISSKENLIIDETLLDHLLENKAAKRIRDVREQSKYEKKTIEEIQTEKLALVIALQKFDDIYGKLLTKEQKLYLEKYYTTTDAIKYKRWVDKKVNNLIDEIANKSPAITDEKITEKIELVNEKLKGIVEQKSVSTSNLKDILLIVEMKDKLDLF
jgi:hypothetical protein